MTTRLVLHIGTHKTGTTSIQRALHFARDDLAAKGVLYPLTDRDRDLRLRLRKHGELSLVARTGTDAQVAAERDALVEEIEASGAHTVIVSEEGLSGPNARAPAFFAPLRERYALEVICYLRRQDSFAESFYNQVVKRGERAFEGSIIDFIGDTHTRQRLDYHTMLRRWTDIGARVTALEFGSEVKRLGLLPSFATAVGGLDGVALEDTGANPSPDMRIVQLMTELSRSDWPYEERRLLRGGREVHAVHGFPKRSTLLGRHARQALLSDLAESNERLERDYGVRFDDRMPEEPDEPIGPVESAYLTALAGALSVPGRQRVSARSKADRQGPNTQARG